MSGGSDQTAHEIVIVRRHGGDHEEGHHGGAWKIAYADFMTAMMAFFLVMWLINSTDDKTITQVATYFNPLRLNDKSLTRKGLHDPGAGAPQPSAADEHPEPKHAKEKKNKKKKEQEQAAAEGHASKASSAAGAASGGRGGEQDLFADPYGLLQKLEVQFLAEHPDARLDAAAAGNAKPAASHSGAGARQDDPFDLEFRRTTSQALPPAPVRAPEPVAPTAPAAKAATAGADNSAAALEREIARGLSGIDTVSMPGIEVRSEDGGLLVSLTDRFDFGMFQVGSAAPSPTLVVVMQIIGRSLASQPGKISVRGHTDGRPYRTQHYDNWRLSTARAHMAHHMLVRGGVAEDRFEHIEGWADRKLKAPDDPGGAVNRRLEILVRSGK